MPRFEESLSVGAAPTAATPPKPSPVAVIVLAVLLSSGALMLVGFLLRIARMDGNVNAAAQWAIGGMLVPWVLLGIGCLLLMLREFVFVLELTTQHDLNRDQVLGNPERYLTIRGGYAAPAESAQRMTLAEFVRKCSESGTAWHSVWSVNGTLRGPIGQPEWETKRNILIGAQKADWNNAEFPNAGWHLTASADTIIRELGQ